MSILEVSTRIRRLVAFQMPSQSDLFSYFFDFDSRRFETWEHILPVFNYNPKLPCHEIVVPTVDTIRFGFLMEKILTVKRSVLYTGQCVQISKFFQELISFFDFDYRVACFTGDTGVGKSVVARALLESVAEERNFLPVYMHFSAQTSSSRTQDFIESKLERKKKNVLCKSADALKSIIYL